MQKCENCKVLLRGNFEVCPLCGSIISQKEENADEVFPNIPTIFQEFNFFIRMIIMVSIAIIVISFAVNLIFTRESKWSLIVTGGVVCMWISLFFLIRKKSNIPKTIVWQVVLLSILSVLWDWSIGWIGWSINFVIPTICVVAMIAMAIAAKILRIGVRDFIVYLFLDGMFGFIPIIFILSGGLDVLFPSVICVAVSAISLSALILFQGDSMKAELKKKMHI